MAEARCLAVARRLAAQVPQDGLAEKTWKQSNRSYEIESFSKGCLWLRLGVWLWPDIWLHRCHKMVLQRKHGSKASAVMKLKALVKAACG